MNHITQDILGEIKKVIQGKDEVILNVLSAFLAGGHILLEDLQGVGKTTLALALSRCFGLDFCRIQLTPDTVAGDITGFTAYDSKTGKFSFHSGAAMTDLLLADELNRTSGKTQSALLEAMEEGKCTVDGVTYQLPKPFTVIATQNPKGSAGTSELPVSQLDRFMVRLSIGQPDRDSLVEILKSRNSVKDPLDDVRQVCTKDRLLEIRRECGEIFVSQPILDYIADLCEKSHNSERILCGISPRGAVSLMKISKAKAYTEGRDYVIPADVRANFINVCAHRIILAAGISGGGHIESAADVLNGILSEVPCPENSRG